jgi:hypothetical protein
MVDKLTRGSESWGTNDEIWDVFSVFQLEPQFMARERRGHKPQMVTYYIYYIYYITLQLWALQAICQDGDCKCDDVN